MNRRSPRVWIYPVFFVAWQICAIPLYQAEWKGARLAADLLFKSADDRRAYADGPIYLVLKVAQELVPAEHSVMFVNPATEAQGEYYEGKVKYYLWPRRIVFVKLGDAFDFQMVSNLDAIVLFDPRGVPAGPVAVLDRLSFFTKAFESSAGRTYQAIYLRNR
jgi:hypothetical protein